MHVVEEKLPVVCWDERVSVIQRPNNNFYVEGETK